MNPNKEAKTKIPLQKIIQALNDEKIPLFINEEHAAAVLGGTKMQPLEHIIELPGGGVKEECDGSE